MSREVTIVENDGKTTKLLYIPNFLTKKQEEYWLKKLDDMDDFIPSINYAGKVSRYQKWYHKKKKYFCEAWHERHPKWKSFNYDRDFIELETIVGNLLDDINIDCCLLNKYNHGGQYISPHRDNLTIFGEYPTILNFSLGSSRDIVFKKKGREEIRFRLDSRSLFIMSGFSQTHEIPRSDMKKDVRYSITLRETKCNI